MVKKKVLPVDVIINDYKSGINTPALAARYGVDRDTISRVLAKAGVPRRGMVARYKDLPMDDIVRDYQAGDTLLTLGQRHGVCDKTIGRLLRRLGVTLRPPCHIHPAAEDVLPTSDIDQLRRAIGWQPDWGDDSDD